jgi:hypothetical protein
MLPERSMRIKASGDVDMVNSISSPVAAVGCAAEETPGNDTMHTLIQI